MKASMKSNRKVFSQTLKFIVALACILLRQIAAEEESLLKNAEVLDQTQPGQSIIDYAWTGNKNSVISAGFKSNLKSTIEDPATSDEWEDYEIRIDLKASYTIASVFIINWYQDGFNDARRIG